MLHSRYKEEANFGLLLAAGLVVVAYLKHVSWLWFIVGFLALMVIVVPRALSPLRKVWLKIGDLLGVVVNYVLLGIVYFLGFVPISLVMRLVGKNPIPLRFESDAKTYWMEKPKKIQTKELYERQY